MDSFYKKAVRYFVYSLGFSLGIGILVGLMYVIPKNVESQGIVEYWWHLDLWVLGIFMAGVLLVYLVSKVYYWAWRRK